MVFSDVQNSKIRWHEQRHVLWFQSIAATHSEINWSSSGLIHLAAPRPFFLTSKTHADLNCCHSWGKEELLCLFHFYSTTSVELMLSENR